MQYDKKMGIGVRVMILKNGKVLLGKRRANLEKAGSPLHGGGTWTMPGGKVDFGENLEEAMFREVLEEAETKIDKDDLRLSSVSYNIINDRQFVTLGFITESFEGEPKVSPGGEIIEWKWFSLDNLPDNLYFASADILNNHLNNKIY